MEILLFVLKYMYIFLLLKIINGFFWPAEIMASPFKNAKIWKKLSILWNTKFQLVTVKYHEVKAIFCKMSRHVEN